MPNHISNRLTIEAKPEQVNAILVAIQVRDTDGAEMPIDFNRIMPMPEVLKNTGSGYSTFDGKRVESWWTDNQHSYNHPDRKPDRLLTDEEQAAIAKTGFDNWYDWRIEKWGTKWNAYHQARSSDNVVTFQTAWSAPLPVLAALAAQHPEARFVLEYADEDIGSNAGIVIYQHGETYSETSLGHRAAAKLWFDLNDCDPNDRGYDPVTFEYVGEEEDAA
jgi:hypothetical protein